MNSLSKEEIMKLIDEAIKISERAYTKYSNFNVGAILIDNNGKKHRGVNVENASYGLTICAERNAISTAVTEGMETIKTIVIVGKTENPISPCGACRQVISEFSDRDTSIILANYKREYKLFSLEDLLPYSFKSSDL